MSGNYLMEVRNQYEEFPYPPVNPEDEKHRLYIPFTEVFSYITHYCFSGKKDMRKDCRYLVAGGGTGSAAICIAEQLMHGGVNSEVVYVDLSETSMEIARKRARIRGIEDRIVWKHGSLLSVTEMDIGTFDYINCSGVLHHLKSPEDGLKALASVLKPEGVLSIMLYAKYGRTAVYQMQELLRLLNQKTIEPQQKVENTKKILNKIPDTNWMLHSPSPLLNELKAGDAAIYDLLLHSQDRAYSIPEVYDYLDTQGLDVIEFFADTFSLGRDLYNPALYIEDVALRKVVQTFSLKDQQAIAELLNGKIYKHTFYAARKIPQAPSLDDLDMVPYFDVTFTKDFYEQFYQIVQQSTNTVSIHLDKYTVTFLKTPHLDFLAKYLDGKRTPDEICKYASQMVKNSSIADLKFEFALMYKTLSHYRFMLLRHKDIPPYKHNEILQHRVNKIYA